MNQNKRRASSKGTYKNEVVRSHETLDERDHTQKGVHPPSILLLFLPALLRLCSVLNLHQLALNTQPFDIFAPLIHLFLSQLSCFQMVRRVSLKDWRARSRSFVAINDIAAPLRIFYLVVDFCRFSTQQSRIPKKKMVPMRSFRNVRCSLCMRGSSSRSRVKLSDRSSCEYFAPE